MRAKAKNKFEEEFFKGVNNSCFGKTMENIRNRINMTLVTSEQAALKEFSKPNFDRCTIFDENLIAVHKKKTNIYFNKPIYLGQSILDLSKTHMYNFHYNDIKRKYDNKAQLLFTDTDSLCYEIETHDFYKDILPDINAKYDTSGFVDNHPSGIKTGINKKVIGMFKDEAGGKIILEFVGLRSKLYSYKMFENSKENKKCKGVKKTVVQEKITHEDYKTCLRTRESQLRPMNMFRSHGHDMYTERVNKIALSSDDDKRHIMEDGEHTLALGHYKLKDNSLKNGKYIS